MIWYFLFVPHKMSTISCKEIVSAPVIKESVVILIGCITHFHIQKQIDPCNNSDAILLSLLVTSVEWIEFYADNISFEMLITFPDMEIHAATMYCLGLQISRLTTEPTGEI